MPTQAWLDTVLDLLISIEENTKKDKIPDEDYNIIDTVRDNFYRQLDQKTGWGRNELKEVFEESIAIAKAVGKESPPWQL